VRPAGHLHHRIGAALSGGAAQLGGLGVTTQACAGLGPVGFEELLFDQPQPLAENGAVDRVEEPVEHPGATEGL
jgi:hypothetical protein